MRKLRSVCDRRAVLCGIGGIILSFLVAGCGGSNLISPPAATPAFSPAGGTYSSARTVTLTDSTAGASIYYTLNGASPTTASILYSSPINISSPTTIKAIATAPGFSASAIASGAYIIDLPGPAFSPPSGTYTSPQTITLTDAIAGASIYYTLDGTTPTTASTPYSSPIKISSTTTIQAIATAPDFSTSAISSETYTIALPAAPPAFSLPSGTYTSTQTVTLTDSTAGASVYYTLDGTNPTTGSTPYSSPIDISSTTTIKAIATAPGFSTSAISSGVFTLFLPAAPPAFSLPSGTFTHPPTVTLTDAAAGATIYFTLDGTSPNSGSYVYSSPFKVFATATVNAIATAPGFSTSAVASAAYTVVLPGDIVCWGDSMTAGDAGVADVSEYPLELQEIEDTLESQQQIAPRVVNQGVGGQTSTQIGVRQGGIPTYVTVEGGSIPAYGDGGVTVTFPTGYEPVTSPGGGGDEGSILGVEGQLTLSAPLPGGKFTFTRISPGDSPVSVPGTPQYIPPSPFARYVSIFWEGRNNVFPTPAGPSGPARILSDIAAQVAIVPAGQHYLVLSVANEDTPEELLNEPGYSTIIRLNDKLSSIYGDHYLDIRSILVNAYNPSLPTDVSDYKNDVVPTSLRAIDTQGTLRGKIGTSDTSFSVNATAGPFVAGEILTIDNENILILDINGSTVTSATRGYGGIVTSHSAGAAISGTSPTHLNKQGDKVVADAVAAKLATFSGSAIDDTPDRTKPATIDSSEPTPQ